MISDSVPFPADDTVEAMLSVRRFADAIIDDLGHTVVEAPVGIAYRDGMVKVAACVKSRAEATLDGLDPEWRAIDQAVRELTEGRG